MDESPVVLPDGTHFPFWDDATEYRRTYHVACGHGDASDENPGTEDRPFKTIGRAAAVLEPCEKAVVHEGVYRECVRPARGGTGPDGMIAYEAAPGEKVVVKGSRVWRGAFRRSEGFRSEPPEDGPRVWAGDLPAEWFVGYNPFMAMNFSSEYTTFVSDWSKAEKERFLLRRGMVFADGRPLAQVYRYVQLAETAGAFWVEDPGLRIHFTLPEDADPDDVTLEVTTQEQVFAPPERGLGYVRVSGFTFEHAADGVPVPQRAMVSASRGHHWIIEDCRVRWANACGVDVGNETWHAPRKAPDEPSGGHILRRNVVSECGICGIAAVGNNAHTLVEDSLIERIGGQNVERIYETGGLKFHTCDGVLIRRNVFRHTRWAPGLWLDYLNRNCRVTGNVFADIESILGACYIEVSHAPNAVDHNVFWDIRRPAAPGDHRPNSAQAVSVDTGERCVVAHNLFAGVRDWYAVDVSLIQSGRIVGGRVGLCRKHKVLNNIFVACPKRILLSRVGDNVSDGNLFDARDDAESFLVEHPGPHAVLDLEAWQEYYGLDRASTQARVEADFDGRRLVLTLEVEREMPSCAPVPELGLEEAPASPGPFDLKPGRQVYELPPKKAIGGMQG